MRQILSTPPMLQKKITEVYVHIVHIHFFHSQSEVFCAFLISVPLRNITPAIQYNSKEQEQRNLMTYGMLYGTKAGRHLQCLKHGR